MLSSKIRDLDSGREYHALDEFDSLLEQINYDLSDKTIIAASKLTGFDVAYRRSIIGFRGIDGINPDAQTCQNIRELTKRTLHMLNEYGGVIDEGFNFPGAYNDIIVNGDADYLTDDTLWDLKVIKGEIGKGHTFQLLLYWRLGMKSDAKKFCKVKYLGVVNPRRGEVCRCDVKTIDKDLIEFVDKTLLK